jgi:hypothetical protein
MKKAILAIVGTITSGIAHASSKPVHQKIVGMNDRVALRAYVPDALAEG